MPKTILLADDSVTIQKVVGISFANEDVVLLTVDNGDDAVTQARESRPDIVLADIVMPGMSGYEVCEALRGDPDLAGVPVLLLSGTFETFDEARAEQVGANGHITKPFEAQALVDRVNALLEAGAVAATPAAAAAPNEASLENSAPAGSSSQAYDFFDEDMPSLSPASPMAETALIGGDAPGDSVSGQVFELDPLEESARPTDALAAPDLGAAAIETPALADETPNAPPEGIEDVFGASFAPEDPVSDSSAFSMDESPELAEAVEAFAHPDSSQGGSLSDFDPLTSPVAAEAIRSMTDESESVPDNAVARGVDENIDATMVHEPAPGPVAGDDLYDGEFGNSGSAYLYDNEADPAGHSFADPQQPTPAVTPTPEPFAEASPLTEATQATSFGVPEPESVFVGEAIAAPTLSEDAAGWDEDPESLSQSALEPLPDLGAVPQDALEAAASAMPLADAAGVEGVGAPAEPVVPVEAPVSDETAVRAEAPALPADLQEKMHATLERVAWEAMGDLSERVIKETLGRIEAIAWEVIPQMAETLIREELDRMKAAEDE